MVQYIDCSEQEFYKKIENKTLICIGAGPMLQDAIANINILDKIDYLIDNNSKIHNTKISISNKEIYVNSIELLCKVDLEKTILLITTRYYESIRKQLEAMFEEKRITVMVYPWIKKYLNKDEDYDKFVTTRVINPAVEFYEEFLEHSNIPKEEIVSLVEKKKNQIVNDINNGKIIVPKIGVRNDSRCSLRCRDCVMLMPYIKEQYHIGGDKVINDLELFFESIDECISIGISDREVFLDKDFEKILKWLIECEKILSISFNTNGTVLPRKEMIPYLKNEKVFIRISDYGYLSSMAKLIELFEENEIKFSVLSEMEWIDSGRGENYGRTKEEQKYVYLRCNNSVGCKVLADGDFYACDRCFRMERLKIKDYDATKDKIKLADYTAEERRKVIWEMYLKDSAVACNFCNLGGMEAKIIEAGVQLEGSARKKSKYTIIRRK